MSQIIEVDPKSNKIVWFFNGMYIMGGSFRSFHISGCQRLPNGNTLIAEGETGRIFEVTKDKKIAWEYNSPFHRPGGPGDNPYSIFKARKVPTSWVPEDISMTPEMVQAATLMGKAKDSYKAANDFIDQAVKLLGDDGGKPAGKASKEKAPKGK